MPRRGENIRHRKDGRWEARIIERKEMGKNTYKSIYAKTYKELKQKLQSLTYLQTSKKESTLLTFNHVLEEWLDYKKNFVKISTYNKYLNVYQKHIKDYMQSYLMKEVNNSLIQNMIIEFLHCNENHKELSSSIISCISYIIKATMSYAQKNAYIETYCLQIDIPSKNKVKKIEVLTKEEQKNLETNIENERNDISLAIIICLYTGLRIGELCALKWDDINLQDRIISIYKTVQRIQLNDQKNVTSKTILEIMHPKTKHSIRKIPITSKLYTILKTYKQERGCFIFKSQKGDIMDPRVIQYQFKAFLKKSDIKIISFHALRHTFATRCIELGMDVKTVSEILGHSNVSTTLSIYVHSTDSHKKEQMELLAQL